MYYYAIINDYCLCTGVISSESVISDNYHVEITEAEFTSQSVVGKWWNTTDNMWDTVRYFSGTTYDINYKGTGKVLQYKLDEMDSAIAGKADSGHTHDDRYYTESEINTTVMNLSVALASKANASDIPTKTSQLENDSGFKTEDTNTTYTLSKDGSEIKLIGSDGSSTSVIDADSNTTYDKATNTVLGLVKVGYGVNGKNYPVELNANGQMFVNVPWTDTNVDTNTTYTLSKSGSTIKLVGSDGSETTVADSDTNTTYGVASSSALGLVKVGFTESGKNYPVELNASGQMFVNVPWTDNDTVYTHPTYTAKASGLYKVTVDGMGHVSGTAAVTKADITGLGIPAQDTVYTLPAAGTALGGVKSGGDVSISNGTITVNDDSHNHVISNVDGLQTALDGKAENSHSHSYLPLSGGTVSGETNIEGVLRVNGQQSFYFQTSTMSQTVGTNNATGGTTICCGSSADVAVNGANLKTPNCLPKANNTYYCGNANFRWKGIYSAAAVNVSSDERLKENIVKLHADEAVDFINSVDVCSFNYIGDSAEQIGVMAQDILLKAPNLAKALVTQDENGYYGVKTSDLVFPLIIAVQELTKQVKELKGE